MGRVIVAVKSCQRDMAAGFHQAIRETWGAALKRKGIQTFFFVAEDTGPNKRTVRTYASDEKALSCPDTYEGLPFKTRAICQWMKSKLFDHLFICDVDTIIDADKLLASGFENYDYSGYFKKGQEEIGQSFWYEDSHGQYPDCYSWASGGMGYFLSHFAVGYVSSVYPTVWAEDMYVGQVLGPKIAIGLLHAGALDLGTNHYRKSPKTPAWTPDVLRRIYQYGTPEQGLERVYEQAV